MDTYWSSKRLAESDAIPEGIDSPEHESYSLNVPNEFDSHSTSGNTLDIEIAVPLLVTLFSLLVLLVVKAFYLKQRRIHGIHQVPIIINRLQETRQDSDKSPTMVFNSTNSKYHASAEINTRRETRRLSRSGFLVGLLGSPAWEADMQRHIADHRWRQHSENHLHRHTWHPYPSTPSTARTYSPGMMCQTSPSIPSPRFDRFECPSIEEIQQANIRRRHSLSITMTHAFAIHAKATLQKRKTLEGVFNSWDNLSGTLSRNVHANAASRIYKNRFSQTPEITVSIADDTNPQNASILLPSNSFRLDADHPSAYAKTRRTVSPCPSHSSFLSLASTTCSKSSLVDNDLDIRSDEEVGLPAYPDEAYRYV